MKAVQITDDVVAATEEACGTPADDWGFVDPREVIAAAVNAVGMEVKCSKCGEFVGQK